MTFIYFNSFLMRKNKITDLLGLKVYPGTAEPLDCRGLIGIAVPAGKRQILTYRKPPLRLGHDVFNFKIDGTKWFLPPAAVLAAAIRPAFNQRT